MNSTTTRTVSVSGYDYTITRRDVLVVRFLDSDTGRPWYRRQHEALARVEWEFGEDLRPLDEKHFLSLVRRDLGADACAIY